MDQHSYVPEPLRVWILEWPAKAVLGRISPRLPNVHCGRDIADNVHRIEGNNSLAPLVTTSHNLCSAVYELHCGRSLDSGLFIFHGQQKTIWLMLEEREGLRDKVYHLAEQWS